MTSQEVREHRESLEQEVKGKRCQCGKLPQVAYRHQEHVIFCIDCGENPPIYRPRSINQEAKEAPKMMAQEVMLARIEEVDRMDEDQIIQELAGDKTLDYVYKFPMEGKSIEGLSWAGYKELALRWGNIHIERPTVEDMGDELRVTVEAHDLVHNVTFWAGTHQLKKRKINGRDGAPDRYVEDTFAYEKAISKAQRNVLKNLLPHAIQQVAIASVLAGKAIPIGRSTEEAPKLPAPKRNALPKGEPPVDSDGVILEGEASMFEDKGQAMKWYKEHHRLNIGDVQSHYPEGRHLQDLSIEEVVEAANKAVAMKREQSAEGQ